MSQEKQKQIEATKESEEKKGRKAGATYLPRHSLRDSLRVPKAIWDDNSGKPFALQDLANRLISEHGKPFSPTSSSFRELIRSAQRYGLIEGSWQQDVTATVSLSKLGTSLVVPTPSDNVNALMRTALETPKIFHDFLESTQGKVFPPQDSAVNFLIRDHHVKNKDKALTCYQVLMKNVDELKIYEMSGNKKYLRLDKLSAVQVTEPSSKTITEEGGGKKPLDANAPIETLELSRSAPLESEEIVKVPRVFISHSKNKKILDQVKKMLDFGGFEYEVAVDSETTAIPIPEKIFGLMRVCTCATINVSADEQEKREDGTYGINQNVLIEIGAAFLQYDKRVILLVDKRVKLPSNLQGLYVSYYQGDELSWDTGMKLQEALTQFRSKI